MFGDLRALIMQGTLGGSQSLSDGIYRLEPEISIRSLLFAAVSGVGGFRLLCIVAA